MLICFSFAVMVKPTHPHRKTLTVVAFSAKGCHIHASLLCSLSVSTCSCCLKVNPLGSEIGGVKGLQEGHEHRWRNRGAAHA